MDKTSQVSPLKRTLAVSLAALTLTGLAMAATYKYKFYINGTKNALDAVLLDGEVYVPVKALKAAGVNIVADSSSVRLTLGAAAAGGQNAVNGVSGCKGETLFNGVWRFKVISVNPMPNTTFNKPGWEITAELRNATPQNLSLSDTGFIVDNATLAFADTQTLPVESWAYNRSNWDHNKTILPGAAYTVKAQVKTDDPHAGQMPTKLVYLRAGNVKSGLPWNTPDPAFRVDLTCTK